MAKRRQTSSSESGSSKNSKGKSGKRKSASADLFTNPELQTIEPVSLREAAQDRYLNYSLSVITSRALPDVRDGLKPVQRRILYSMSQLGINAQAKPRKCMYVCGNVTGNYHPHGESSVYDALVRLAQPWALREPLVDGIGNFGSIDGDNAAAPRYTECRMTPIAAEILRDLGSRIVAHRPNYDGTRQEPVVLPSRVPNMLVNGATGIAVGMATNIPPHNLGEVCRALLKLLKDPEIRDYQLVANDAVQGPDFPTGGHLINTKEELREIYQTGQGSLKVRGTTSLTKEGKGEKTLHITSIPYGVNKSVLVERIAELVLTSKMPLIEDVRDVSTEDIRIDLRLKKDADEAKVLAYLYKQTPLQTNFNVNMTCLVPTENPEVGRPERLGLKEILWHFLHFRLEVVTARLENELDGLLRRMHTLEGFVLIFDALDEIIKIIRQSDGKSDAAHKIMARFPAEDGGLDADQTEAILELKLYRLAKLEINLIQDELKEKRKRASAIQKLLKESTDDTNSSGRWGIVREEIEGLIESFAKSKEGLRRTKIVTIEEEPEYSAEDFIVAEDCHVLVSTDGWVKRQKQIASPAKSRLREGDGVLACVAGSTRSTLGFFSSLGVCYTARFIDIPPSAGYGEPIQKLFKLKDGERIVSVLSLDPRAIGNIAEDPKRPDYCPDVHGFAATSNGFALRFGLAAYAEPSTRSGRRYARVAPESAVVGVQAIGGSETVLAISADCRAMVCPIVEINYLSGPGKGVTLIKLAKTDKLLGFKASAGDRDLLVVETNRGAQKTISVVKYRVTSRGGRGTEIQKNGKISKIVAQPIAAPDPLPELK
ncbi:DNA gyrase/topoisomerase IV subunit A [Aureliella helgolandensis]|uniref:DNA topoisomerase (ATP-hydrolyzing) n=1 Tax=Aureliella helgolandensis TaxID=2527968 RepID=A0A518GC94_9BACT|nr:DNA topoisomerase (ATP-hydrolyzing) [Aureliella helgolandensis]QDV26170.1 DNA gyrase subunit A [Aureliella helgolandensis]